MFARVVTDQCRQATCCDAWLCILILVISSLGLRTAGSRLNIQDWGQTGMSNKRKTGFPKDLWVVEYVDRMHGAGGFNSEPMPRTEAEAELARRTEQGKRATEHDKEALGFYQLRPYA